MRFWRHSRYCSRRRIERRAELKRSQRVLQSHALVRRCLQCQVGNERIATIKSSGVQGYLAQCSSSRLQSCSIAHLDSPCSRAVAAAPKVFVPVLEEILPCLFEFVAPSHLTAPLAEVESWMDALIAYSITADAHRLTPFDVSWSSHAGFPSGRGVDKRAALVQR